MPARIRDARIQAYVGREYLGELDHEFKFRFGVQSVELPMVKLRDMCTGNAESLRLVFQLGGDDAPKDS